MAQGLVTFSSANVREVVDETKEAYANMRRLMDRLIAIRNGIDYEAVAIATGAGDLSAAAGLMLFDNLDSAMGGLTTANNALSNMDIGANN
jgi:hypothetical protein